MWNEDGEIHYYRKYFGIYCVKSMSVLENSYVLNYRTITNSDIEKSFLIKNGRLPTERDYNYQQRIETRSELCPAGSYWFNWYAYSAQNLLIKYPGLMPSSKQIQEVAEETFGHELSQDHIVTIAKLMKVRYYDISLSFYGINVWQWMIIANSLNIIGNKNDISIKLLFNKIYKRDPLEKEIDIIKKLDLTKKPWEIRYEIESSVKLQSTWTVSVRKYFK